MCSRQMNVVRARRVSQILLAVPAGETVDVFDQPQLAQISGFRELKCKMPWIAKRPLAAAHGSDQHDQENRPVSEGIHKHRESDWLFLRQQFFETLQVLEQCIYGFTCYIHP